MTTHRRTLAVALSLLTLGIAIITPALAQPKPAAPTPAATPTKPEAKQPDPIPAAATPEPRADKWWKDKHMSIVQEVKKGDHEIAFIGDSITEQWAGPGKPVWDARLAPLHAVNCGIGGDQTQHVLARLDDGLLDALAAPNNHIRTVVLLIGTNNVSNPACTGADIGTGVTTIVSRLRAKLPDAKIILMSVFPRGEKPNAQRNTIAEANVLLAKLADDKHVFLVDLGPKFLGKDSEIPKSLMPDFLHLSETGYTIWADGIKDKLESPKK